VQVGRGTGAPSSYKQQKFNLLREESEGYSKLTVELDVALSRGGSPALAEPLVRVVQSLIGGWRATGQHGTRATADGPRDGRPPFPGTLSAGFFDLDPNRVLDQILNVCERYPDAHPLWVRLLELYHAPANTLCQILGRKFQTTKVRPAKLAWPLRWRRALADRRPSPAHCLCCATQPGATGPSPFNGLAMVAARLLARGLVTLTALYPHVRGLRPQAAWARHRLTPHGDVPTPRPDAVCALAQLSPDDAQQAAHYDGLAKAVQKQARQLRIAAVVGRRPWCNSAPGGFPTDTTPLPWHRGRCGRRRPDRATRRRRRRPRRRCGLRRRPCPAAASRRRRRPRTRRSASFP